MKYLTLFIALLAGAFAQPPSTTPASHDLFQNLRLPFPPPVAFNIVGDSQIYGTNAATRPYISGGRIKEGYRIPQIIAKTAGISTVNNWGVPSSRISWNTSNASSKQSSFNVLGSQIGNPPDPGGGAATPPNALTGVWASMATWNNLGQGMAVNDRTREVLMNARMAEISRVMIDYWGGVTHLGWELGRLTTGTADTSPTPGWVCTGSTVNPGADADMPVPFKIEGSDTARITVALDAGEYIQFNVGPPTGTGYSGYSTYVPRALALHFDTTSAGGGFIVKVNGTTKFTGTSQFTAPLGDSFPGVVWLDGVTIGDVIRFEATSGIVQWVSFGSPSDTTAIYNKLFICASPTANPANGRTTSELQMAFMAAKDAVAAFAPSYPVLFADTQTNWVTSRDQEPDDISHLTAKGNAQIAQQILNAYRPARKSNPFFIDL